MAFRAINDSELKVDSPVDVALVTALRDNCLAIAAGTSGAPKVAFAALELSVGGTESTGEWDVTQTAGFVIPNQYIHDMDIIQQIHNKEIAHSQFTVPQRTNSIISQGFTIRRGGSFSFVVSGMGINTYNNTFRTEILVDDVVIKDDVTPVRSFAFQANIATIDYIYDVELTAGQVIKLRTTGNAVESGGGSYYNVLLNIVSENYMGEITGMQQRATSSGVYNTSPPNLAYAFARAIPHPQDFNT